MDIKRDVEWTVYPLAELKQALEKKEVDAISVTDPTGELLLSEGFARDIVNSSTDAPYKDEWISPQNAPTTSLKHTKVVPSLMKSELQSIHLVLRDAPMQEEVLKS
jgi:hypothetical protein